MKIAYITNYVGPEFIEKFCNGKNFSISATHKSTAIARAFQKLGHEVTIFSPGLTVCNRFIKSHKEIIPYPEGTLEIVYPSLISFRKASIINTFLLYLKLRKSSKIIPFDALLYYNITFDAFINMHSFRNKLHILEYEDNIFNRALKGGTIKSFKVKKSLFSYVIKRTDAALITGKGMLANNEISLKVLIPGAVTEDVLNNISFDRKTRDTNAPVRLLLAGGMHYSKGVDLIIKALSYIKFPCELLLYGSGSLEPDSEALLEDVPSYHKVLMRGFTRHDELIKIMTENADILINSTRNMGVEPNSEGYPFKMMEYASTGRPIVSSPIGMLDDEFNELVKFYKNEDPVEIAQVITEVIEHYSDHAQKAELLQKRIVSEFSISGLAYKLDNLLNLIKERNGN